jgi:hypothetical protein
MSVQSEVIRIQSRFGVTTHNTLLKQEVGADKLLIMLPGRAYTCDFPALYYLRSAAVQLGYDVLSVEYGFQAAHTDFGFQQAPDLVADVNDTVQPVLARKYKQVVVAGKSLGTPLASNLARSITDVAVSLILLTPVGDSTQDLDGLRTLVVIGTKDAMYSPETVSAFEGHPDVKWCVFEGLDHGFEVAGQWRDSLSVMPQIIEACATFLSETP